MSEAPVDDLRLAELAHHDVGRLQVAVHDPVAMGPRDGVGRVEHVAHEAQALLAADLAQRVVQRPPPHDPHRIEGCALGVAPRVVHRDDARVLEACGDPRLTREARLHRRPDGHAAGIDAAMVGAHFFERDVAVEASVVRDHDAPHAADTQHLASLVAHVFTRREAVVGRCAHGFGKARRGCRRRVERERIVQRGGPRCYG